MTKRVLCVVLVVMFVVGATAFGRGAKDDASVTKVEFWTFPDWGVGQEGETFRQFVAEFEQKNPDIKVEFVPRPELEQAIITGAGSGILPDAFTVAFNQGDTFLRTGIVQDLAEWFNAMPAEFRNQFSEKWMSALSPDGKVYGLPFTAYAQLLYRNLTVLERAGVDASKPLRDWDDWIATMEKVNDIGLHSLSDMTQDGWFVMGFVGAAGGANGAVNGRTTVGAAEIQKALELYERFKPFALEVPTGDQAAVDLFTTNRLAYYVMGPWQNPAFLDAAKANPEFRYDYTLVPGARTGLHGGTNGGEWIGVTESPRAEAAWKWAAFIADAPQATRFALTGRTVLNSVAMADPEVQRNELNALTARATGYGFADAAYFTYWPLEARVPFRDAAQAVYGGRVGAAAAAQKAVADLNAVLARGR